LNLPFNLYIEKEAIVFSEPESVVINNDRIYLVSVEVYVSLIVCKRACVLVDSDDLL